jgi:hypothetical protein
VCAHAYYGSRTHVEDGATYCARLLSCIVLPFAGCCVVCLQLAAAATLPRCAPLTGAWTAPSCRATAQRARSCTGTHAQVSWPAHYEVIVLSATKSVSCHMACLFNFRTRCRRSAAQWFALLLFQVLPRLRIMFFAFVHASVASGSSPCMVLFACCWLAVRGVSLLLLRVCRQAGAQQLPRH